MSQQVSNFKNKIPIEQLVSIALLSCAWLMFVFSAENYRNLNWYHTLLISRIFLVLFGCIIFILSLTKMSKNINYIFIYLNLSLFFQALHGSLEASNSVEFYNFTGLIFLAACLSYRGRFNNWSRIIAPLQLTLMLIPLFFKEKVLLFPFKNFVDNFSLMIAGIILGTIIVKINSTKFKALLSLIEAKDAYLHLEKSMKDKLSRDLDEAKKKIEEESKKQILSDLAIQVAHDIRAPLTALQVANSAFQEGNSAVAKTLMNGAINRIRNIAEDLLLRTNPQQIATESFSAAKAIEEIIFEKQVIYPHANFEMKTTSDIYLTGNRSNFLRAISNFVNNSIDAATGNRELKVQFTLYSNKIVLTDNGKGMTSSMVRDLILGNVKSTKESGHGLGFKGSTQMLKQMGFNITLESQPSDGTTITLNWVGEPTALVGRQGSA